ncbi:hypothetical protein ACN38_g7706 [Penicillium nordicum]|uniref:Uncharacterized protein n=1 Tax=Penicillium nordicum TaxID=229535 RepID=A0A0M8NYI1_9EURO|nr:hypothetical protein ACN38_g7706 [Penicillium nordicum]
MDQLTKESSVVRWIGPLVLPPTNPQTSEGPQVPTPTRALPAFLAAAHVLHRCTVWPILARNPSMEQMQ